MSRKIKFRMWDAHNKDLKFRVFDKDGDMRYGVWPVGNTVYDPNGGFWLHNVQAVMQYTGLKDKNGKEIYEGDIVRVPDPYSWAGDEPSEDDRELWRGGTAQVVSSAFGFSMQEIDCGMWTFNGPEGEEWTSREIEVIGNIYENPELLKP